MLTAVIEQILDHARQQGWVTEPETKRLLALAGLDVPRFEWVRDEGAAAAAAADIGYPVVVKVVSAAIVHKSDAGGVVTGIQDAHALQAAFRRFARLDGFDGMLIEETLTGIELILGAQIDLQFGPVILLGMGGTGVEIYQDTALRLAPLESRDVVAMLAALKARPLLDGYRGAEPIDRNRLVRTVVGFSKLVMALADRITSVDINPLICSARCCTVADARIMLAAD